MCRPLESEWRFLTQQQRTNNFIYLPESCPKHSPLITREGSQTPHHINPKPQCCVDLLLLDLDTLVSVVTDLAANVLPSVCSVWGKVNVLRLLSSMNTHQCLWNGRWLSIGNKLEYSVFYGTNREIKLHFPCFCMSNHFGEPAGWTEEQLHDKSVCVMFHSDDTLRRRQGFKKEDEGNKDISGCFKTECFCPE